MKPVRRFLLLAVVSVSLAWAVACGEGTLGGPVGAHGPDDGGWTASPPHTASPPPIRQVIHRNPFGNVAARSRLTSAEVEHRRLERAYAQQQRTIELEVRDIEIRLRKNVHRLRDLATGVEQARAKREIARGRFELGLANNFVVTDADRDLVEAESQLLQAVVDYASSVAFLEASIGAPI